MSYAREATCWYTGCWQILEIRKHERPLKIFSDNKECTVLRKSGKTMVQHLERKCMSEEKQNEPFLIYVS